MLPVRASSLLHLLLLAPSPAGGQEYRKVHALLHLLLLAPGHSGGQECGRVHPSIRKALEKASRLNRMGQERIVGGQAAKENAFPWQAKLVIKGLTSVICSTKVPCEGLCGGTVVSKRYVLTAAHCVEKDVELRGVHLGLTDIHAKGSVYRVGRIFVHPKRNIDTKLHDMALLLLRTEIDFVDHRLISPACLPSSPQDSPVEGAKVMMMMIMMMMMMVMMMRMMMMIFTMMMVMMIIRG